MRPQTEREGPIEFKYNIRFCRYVPLTYLEAAAATFGTRPFSVSEFAARVGNRRPERLLHDLKTRGAVERLERGKYRVLPIDERPDLRGPEASRVRRLLLGSGLPMAWTSSDAVNLWTGGRYSVSPSAFLREFHVEIPRGSLARWKRYLHANRISSDPRRSIGAKVVLSPVESFRHAWHRGEPVIPRKETLALIKSHRGLYAEADRLLEH